MIYLCSVYSLNAKTDSRGDKLIRQLRTNYTRKRLAKFLCGGKYVISPISHLHEVSIQHDLPKDYTFFKAYDHALMDCCDEVYVLQMEDSAGSWEDSEGITDEIEYAKETGKKITYISCEDYI